ncbi:MAG: nucleotidyl transferase AbiEii/AbiGii toxin family protein [Nitrospirae bacterium]|nr:nucleotidyl transferase AbiEii/AbiGii toxin family protein [Nitrospirota bacterium]
MNMKKSPFFTQAELMLRVIPHIAKEKTFALKGGTAINFFFRDMPRLSIDIDLTYVPIEPRDVSLKKMSNALGRIAGAIQKTIPDIKVQKSHFQKSKRIRKLFVSHRKAQITIEPNEVIRGTVFPCENRNLCMKAEDLFELTTSIQTLSLADLYGGKLCAALDRQHPRDLFDIKILLENEGVTNDIRKAFVIYLASHDRPMNELIDPIRKDLHQIYKNEFSGMTVSPVSYEELTKVRDNLITVLKTELTNAEKVFLVSIKEGNPNWDLMEIKGIEKLPAIQWKVMNIRKMDKKKHKEALSKLRTRLGI